MAAELSKEPDIDVETIKGGFGQFEVFVDGRSVVKTNRFLYPNAGRVVERVKEVLVRPPGTLP
ncbi:MAG TPA: hypothetical protein VFE84_14635 [Patescibacteria group bacterium]|nr:hypothetical protein [Patescibacteria group bacterium]